MTNALCSSTCWKNVHFLTRRYCGLQKTIKVNILLLATGPLHPQRKLEPPLPDDELHVFFNITWKFSFDNQRIVSDSDRGPVFHIQ